MHAEMEMFLFSNIENKKTFISASDCCATIVYKQKKWPISLCVTFLSVLSIIDTLWISVKYFPVWEYSPKTRMKRLVFCLI